MIVDVIVNQQKLLSEIVVARLHGSLSSDFMVCSSSIFVDDKDKSQRWWSDPRHNLSTA